MNNIFRRIKRWFVPFPKADILTIGTVKMVDGMWRAEGWLFDCKGNYDIPGIRITSNENSVIENNTIRYGGYTAEELKVIYDAKNEN